MKQELKLKGNRLVESIGKICEQTKEMVKVNGKDIIIKAIALTPAPRRPHTESLEWKHSGAQNWIQS